MKNGEIKNEMGLKIGDILCSCFGYDASIYDFYEVVGVSKKNVRIRELRKRNVPEMQSTEWSGCIVAPVVEGQDRFANDEIMTRKPFNFSRSLDPARTGIHINQCADAYLWDGLPCDQYNAH